MQSGGNPAADQREQPIRNIVPHCCSTFVDSGFPLSLSLSLTRPPPQKKNLRSPVSAHCASAGSNRQQITSAQSRGFTNSSPVHILGHFSPISKQTQSDIFFSIAPFKKKITNPSAAKTIQRPDSGQISAAHNHSLVKNSSIYLYIYTHTQNNSETCSVPSPLRKCFRARLGGCVSSALFSSLTDSPPSWPAFFALTKPPAKDAHCTLTRCRRRLLHLIPAGVAVSRSSPLAAARPTSTQKVPK